MNLTALLRPRILLGLGGLAALVGCLTLSRPSPASMLPERAAVWVFYTSLCAKPGDSSDCRVVAVPVRPSFPSMEACSDHRDRILSEQANPRLMGSCLKQQET